MPTSQPPSGSPQTGVPAPVPIDPNASFFTRDLAQLKQRLVREATAAVGMLEAALDALWNVDKAAAKEVRRRDDRIDEAEVEIEESTLRLMTLNHAFAREFRALTFVLKVNADVERTADHATSIAKTVNKVPEGVRPQWPTALMELGQRVPIVCHALLRALLNEDADAARAIVAGDETIDALHRRLFDETLDFMSSQTQGPLLGLLVYRVGRELERIADLMANIAEDIVYLRTGQIIRHEKRRQRNEPAPIPE